MRLIDQNLVASRKQKFQIEIDGKTFHYGFKKKNGNILLQQQLYLCLIIDMLPLQLQQKRIFQSLGLRLKCQKHVSVG